MWSARWSISSLPVSSYSARCSALISRETLVCRPGFNPAWSLNKQVQTSGSPESARVMVVFPTVRPYLEAREHQGASGGGRRERKKPSRTVFVPLFAAGVMLAVWPVGAVLAQTDNPAPPATAVKLVFVHHSTGENWLRDDYGGLGVALGQNNYFVSDTNYGWGPNAIGDTTDIPDWRAWFDSADTSTILAALFAESSTSSS